MGLASPQYSGQGQKLLVQMWWYQIRRQSEIQNSLKTDLLVSSAMYQLYGLGKVLKLSVVGRFVSKTEVITIHTSQGCYKH